MPSQCAWMELLILPCNNQAMEWPRPHPGHQVMPSIFKGHSEKWASADGLETARLISAAVQNISSRFFAKKCLINFSCFGH